MTRCGTTAGCCGACGLMPGATFGGRSQYNEGPMKRFGFAVLLVVQALASGAVSLAHARDVLVAPAGIEASHSSRCDACGRDQDRKSTRLNSSHSQISYAVFCLKKKKRKTSILVCTSA